MALNLYRRHYRLAGKCVAGHEPDSRSYEPDELRRGWKKCYCPIYACGTLARAFKRKNTERVQWDEAKGIAAGWEAAGRWSEAPVATIASAPVPEAQNTRMKITDAIRVFMSLREGEKITHATLRKYRTFTKQILAFAESRGYVMLDQVTSAIWTCFMAVSILVCGLRRNGCQPCGHSSASASTVNGFKKIL